MRVDACVAVLLAASPVAVPAQGMGSPPPAVRASASASGTSNADRDFTPRVQHDAFDKSTTTIVDIAKDVWGGDKQCTNAPSYERVSISLAKLDPPDSGLSVVLVVRYTGNAWLFMDPSAPVRFLIADTVVAVPVLAVPTQEPVAGSEVTEVADAAPTRAQLRAIGSADSTTMRIVGRRGQCDVRLTRKALRLVQLFDQRILGDSAAR